MRFQLRLMTWLTVGGKTNFVQATLDLGSGFAEINPALAITDIDVISTNCLEVGVATNFPSRFYHVRLVP